MKSEIYVRVSWPASQLLMEEEWFNECILDTNSAADYLIPMDRYEERYKLTVADILSTQEQDSTNKPE